MSGKKNTSRAKLKDASLEERLHKWKEHFKNQLRNIPENIDKPIQRIINSQQDIKLKQFTEEELDKELKKLKTD